MTLGASDTEAVAIPAGTRSAHVVCTVNGGRVLAGSGSTAPALTATSYGYLAAGVSMEIKFAAESHLYLGGGAADNTFYVTFGN